MKIKGWNAALALLVGLVYLSLLYSDALAQGILPIPQHEQAISVEGIDFGDVPVGRIGKRKFDVTNHSNQYTLYFGSIRVLKPLLFGGSTAQSNFSFSSRCLGKRLAPGQTCRVTVYWAPDTLDPIPDEFFLRLSWYSNPTLPTGGVSTEYEDIDGNATQQVFLRGDVDMNGSVGYTDLFLYHASYWEFLTTCTFPFRSAADVNGDGELSFADYQALIDYLEGTGDDPAEPFPAPGVISYAIPATGCLPAYSPFGDATPAIID